MRTYLIRRLLLVVPAMLGISFITFALIHAAPGSPISQRLFAAEGMMGADAASAEVIEEMKKLYGFDKPWHVRYLDWLGRMVTFDFGASFKDHRPVIERIGEALPITLMFNALSVLLIYLIAIPVGIYSATHPRTIADYGSTLLLFFLFSLPSFWVAVLLIMFLGGGQYLDWFPVAGLSSLGASDMPWPQWLADRAWHMALPLFCLTYASFAGLSRYMRTSMLETIRQDYIRTARAYGFRERTVVYKYALRNSIISIITLLGSELPVLISGSVIIETIFSIPGMGRLAFEALTGRDYPTIMAVFTISALLTLAGLILSDILYALADPRIRLG